MVIKKSHMNFSLMKFCLSSSFFFEVFSVKIHENIFVALFHWNLKHVLIMPIDYSIKLYP